MKLSELCEIRRGIYIDKKLLINIKPKNGTYYEYKDATLLTEGGNVLYVAAKEVQKLPNFQSNILLNYGDYLIYKHQNSFKIIRHTQSDGQTILADSIILLRTDYNIIAEFLGNANNRNYLLNEINNNINSDILNIIANIEVNTDNIKELDEVPTAEQIGLRRSIDPDKLPLNITKRPMPLDKLMKRLKHEELLLDTEFQRKPGLWNNGTKSRFMETLLIDVPVPAFYFDGENDEKWLVIDGLQRLSTVNDYLNDKFVLENLDYLGKELEGKRFSELERKYQRKIEEYEVFAYILQKGTPPSVKYKIFKNINTSALILEAQEIRHAINPNKPANFLKQMVTESWFQAAVPVSDRQRERMYDREIVLRFIAFQRKSFLQYSPSIVDFLDDAMYDIYNIPETKLSDLSIKLKNCVENSNFFFDNSCFSRNIILDKGNTYIHNNIIFELLTYGFSKIEQNNINLLKRNKTKVREQIISFFKNQGARFWEHDYAYSQEGLIKRFQDIEKLINDLIKRNNK